MKLTYWAAECLNDSKCYNIRERTKKAAVEAKAKYGGMHGPVVKIVVEYQDGFDLLNKCLGEGGLYAESKILSEVRIEGSEAHV